MFGVHISAIIPAVGCVFTGLPWYVLVLWIGTSVLTHYSGFGLIGFCKRMKIKLGRYLHGNSRIRKDKFVKIKRNRGSL